MKNPTITEINSLGDVDFDQEVDTDTAIASGGGIAVNGDANHAVFNTGLNTGVIAGGSVEVQDSVLGNGNFQVNDSEVGAFSARGDALNIEADNVNMGKGDLIDVDSEGDAQVVTGNGNDVTGDIDIDIDEVEGPVNLAVGHDIDQTLIEDESKNFDDSFNLDASVEDSGNTLVQDSFNQSFEQTNLLDVDVDGSFNSQVEDNDTSIWDWNSSQQSNHFEDDYGKDEIELPDLGGWDGAEEALELAE